MPKKQKSPVLSAVSSIIKKLDAVKFKAPPREYALIARATNMLANAVGLRVATRPVKRKPRKGKVTK